MIRKSNLYARTRLSPLQSHSSSVFHPLTFWISPWNHLSALRRSSSLYFRSASAGVLISLGECLFRLYTVPPSVLCFLFPSVSVCMCSLAWVLVYMCSQSLCLLLLCVFRSVSVSCLCLCVLSRTLNLCVFSCPIFSQYLSVSEFSPHSSLSDFLRVCVFRSLHLFVSLAQVFVFFLLFSVSIFFFVFPLPSPRFLSLFLFIMSRGGPLHADSVEHADGSWSTTGGELSITCFSLTPRTTLWFNMWSSKVVFIVVSFEEVAFPCVLVLHFNCVWEHDGNTWFG